MNLTTFRKATKAEFTKMTVQQRKEYLESLHNFIYRDEENPAESVHPKNLRGAKPNA